MLERALALARTHRDRAEADLFEELRIPSVSTDPARREDVRRNAEWLRARFEAIGFTATLTDVPGGDHPVLQADWMGAPGAATATIYGHYDVQPPDPLDEWTTGAFDPQVRDGHVYARGCADNKGNHMAALKAAEYLVGSGGAPVNLRFLIEGEEECSGPSLPRYIAENRDRLKSDYTFIWDDGFRPEAAALVTGLRGLLYTQLDAEGPSVDVHSGSYGGVSPNPVNTLARIVGELKDRDGRITIPGFYDGINKPASKELEALRGDDVVAPFLQRELGVEALEGEVGFMAAHRLGMRPTLDANGFSGGFTGEGMKTVIPARASAKVSMRLVPGQDPETIFEAMERYVQELTTPGVRVTTRKLAAALPVLLPTDHRAARAAAAAFVAAFGSAPVYVREGGSIPVTLAFQEHVGGEIVCSGIIQHDGHAHSPNERLSLDHYHRGTEMLIHMLVALGGEETAA
jgi:acetylornithine deacetylase/succinyl-diaminopimelate desuccinylase-like protein